MVFKLNNQMLSKMAIGDGNGENNSYFDGWKAYDSDPYHHHNNPDGVIQMGLAENQLCFDLVEEWLKKYHVASICTPEGVGGFKDVAIFQDYHGWPKFRNAVAKFMGKVRGDRLSFDLDRIVMAARATEAHETVAFCLADPGEALLVPNPYYPGPPICNHLRVPSLTLNPVKQKGSSKVRKRDSCSVNKSASQVLIDSIAICGGGRESSSCRSNATARTTSS